MKRFWLVLLSLGLVMAFSVSAFAVDVKVSAEYFAAGLYLNKVAVNDGYGEAVRKDNSAPNPSTAFFYQRLRVGTDFVVSPCLKLVTRFDAMERIWGGNRSNTWQINQMDEVSNSGGTRAESENIAFDVVYIDYTSPIGLFKVGYMPDYQFGTVFADNGSAMYDGQIQYYVPIGPATLFLGYSKITDNSWSANSTGSWYWLNNLNATRTDRDYDSYRMAGVFNFKGGEAGALLLWERDATQRGNASTPFGGYMRNVFVIDPFVKAKVGPVALQAELLYYFGDAYKWQIDGAPVPNVSVSALSVFVDATANFGMFYAGGSLAYLSGDDPGTNDKVEGGVNNAGLDYNPCLIMFNTETLGYWVGPITGHTNSVVDAPMSNAWFFQGRAGVKPMPALDIMMSVSYAMADKKPRNPNYTPGESGITYANGTYGTEIDLTGTYKITNNLSYMLGAGYLFTGDYFKGFDRAGQGYQTVDDFILINKLTLSF